MRFARFSETLNVRTILCISRARLLKKAKPVNNNFVVQPAVRFAGFPKGTTKRAREIRMTYFGRIAQKVESDRYAEESIMDVLLRVSTTLAATVKPVTTRVRFLLLPPTPEKRKRTVGSNHREDGGREVALVR